MFWYTFPNHIGFTITIELNDHIYFNTSMYFREDSYVSF